MIKKTAYAVQMSYEVSSVEKTKAEQSLLLFAALTKVLRQADDYLNIMKTPFKDNPNMTPEDVMKARAALRRFRDKAIENFNFFKDEAFKCVNIMQTFSNDSQVVKLMKSFITTIDQLEAEVNDFSHLFDDLQNKEFTKQTVDQIEKIQTQCQEIDEIINERIKDHIQNNILATTWVDSVSDKLQTKIDKKTPLMVDLFNQQQDQLNNTIKERSTLGN